MDNAAVANNSLIVQRSSSCYYCRVYVYCYSNTTSTSVGYYIFPDGFKTNAYNHYHYYSVSQVTNGVSIHNYRYNTPSIWGIFTCEMPDSEGNTVETSIGIYSSMPGKDILTMQTHFPNDIISSQVHHLCTVVVTLT